jgi:hypothetical protein
MARTVFEDLRLAASFISLSFAGAGFVLSVTSLHKSTFDRLLCGMSGICFAASAINVMV